MSVCVDGDLPASHVELSANERNPTSLDHGWHIANESFETGEPNPCPCDTDPERKHYLLSC